MLFIDFYAEWLDRHLKSGINSRTIASHEVAFRWVERYLSALSGLRLGEVMALTFDDFDRDNYTVSVTKTRTLICPFTSAPPKTKNFTRVVSVHPKFFDKLNEYIEETGNTDLWHDILGESVTKRLDKIIRDNNFQKITFHGLRHTHASYLINSGIDTASVSKLLGHADIAGILPFL